MLAKTPISGMRLAHVTTDEAESSTTHVAEDVGEGCGVGSHCGCAANQANKRIWALRFD
jgi:bacterioferritin-associated ferredoxin